MPSDAPAQTLASATSERGELALRRRGDGALELRVNGVFVMDTFESSSERALARAVLDLEQPHRLLVGGLGLGFTTAELLRDPRVRQVVVAEIEPAVVRWMSDDTIPGGASILADARVGIVVADVADVVAAQEPGTLDAVLLDVDNGPDFLVLDVNAALYRIEFLRTCLRRLRPSGMLAVWSSTRSPVLEAALVRAAGSYARHPHHVDLAGHPQTYTIYSVTASHG